MVHADGPQPLGGYAGLRRRESWLECATIARMPARAAVAMTAGVLAERTIKAWSPRECCITEAVTGLLIRRVITWLVNRAIAA